MKTNLCSLSLACVLSTALTCGLVPVSALADGSSDSSQDSGTQTAEQTGTATESVSQSTDTSSTQDEQNSASTTKKAVKKKKVKAAVSYQVDRKKGSWTKRIKGKKVAGEAVWTSELERIRIKAQGPHTGGIKYAVRSVGEDWDDWEKNDAVAGTNKQSLEAVKIKLTGKLAKHYSVYYRVYVAEHGWLGWAHDGQKAGTGESSYPIGAIRVRLVREDKDTPTPVKKHYTTKLAKKGGTEWTMNSLAQKQSSPTKWLIMLNRTRCRLGVFKGEKGAWKLKRYCIVSCGKKSTPTPTGTYHIGQRFSPLGESYNAYYAIRVTGYIHMHSILYWPHTYSVKDGRLGKHVSHGCIRMKLEDVRWIYKTLPDDTTINIH